MPTTPSKPVASTRAPRYRPATELVFLDPTDGTLVRDPYNASSVPIYQTATFKQPSAHGSGEYDYSRSGNPTRTQLESHLAKIMGAERAFAVSSGMSALDVILRMLKTDDEVIAGDDLYGGTNRLLSFLHKQLGIKTHHVDTTDVAAVVQHLDAKRTRFVLLETPTNPMVKIANIPQIADIVHTQCPRALVVVDNTMMSPYLQRTLDLGADIEYHSGTKYLSGHHDLMAGVIGVKSAEVGDQVYFAINATGCGLAPFDSWLLLRGVKTLAVRMDRQQSNAEKLAQYLVARGLRVHYPGLKTHPQYALHKKMALGPGAVLSFETGSVTISERIVEATKLFSISVSFGCVNSLISMPCHMSHASIPASVREARSLPEDVVRLCVGVEHVDDLLEDLESALAAAGLVPN